MMKIGSHNSFTYLPIKKWWLKPFKFMAQCQGKTIEEQFEYGARLFDIRVVFDKEGIPSFAHGSIEFKGNVISEIAKMNNFPHPVWCRVINERNENFGHFALFCKSLEISFKNIKFFGGRNKKDWKVIYRFKNDDVKIIDKYSSWNNDTKIGTGWHLDDLFPRIYAICFNKMWRNKLGNDKTFLMQDFVGIY